MVVAVVWRCTGRCWLFLGFELRGGVGNDGVPLEKTGNNKGSRVIFGALGFDSPPPPARDTDRQWLLLSRRRLPLNRRRFGAGSVLHSGR